MKTIGRYEVLRLLGKGGMSKVYQVRVPILNKIVALKYFEPGPRLVQVMGLATLRKQFMFEAEIIANLRHPNILDIWSLEEENGSLFYLMEFYCQNLGSVIGETYWVDSPSRIIPVGRAVHYIEETLEGIERLHCSGIIHRDIKPFNIMLTDQDTVKIADFGLSKRRGERTRLPDDLFIGTKVYAAPEQEANPDSADVATDMYSVGVMFYRLLTGRLPVHPVVSPSDLNSNLNSDWDAFLLKSISMNPAERFSGAGHMREGLLALYERFQEDRERHCRMIQEEAVPKTHDATLLPEADSKSHPAATSIPAVKRRSTAVVITHQQARDFFRVDELWRPLEYSRNRLAPLSNVPATVENRGTDTAITIVDYATHLVWQQSGSPYPLNWEGANHYIDNLNQEGFAGSTHWRMPTVDELLSILQPSAPGEDFCATSLFSPIQKWIWSTDRRSLRAAWYVNMEMGFAAAFDLTGFFHARAVRDLNSEPHPLSREPESAI